MGVRGVLKLITNVLLLQRICTNMGGVLSGYLVSGSSCDILYNNSKSDTPIVPSQPINLRPQQPAFASAQDLRLLTAEQKQAGASSCLVRCLMAQF